MLSVTGINCFYYLWGFTNMRCKHSRVLSVIREQLHREPSDGDIYIVMSKDRRIVRLFAYDNCSYCLFEKKFVAGYQFMRVIKDDECNEVSYRIDWKDVVLLLENYWKHVPYQSRIHGNPVFPLRIGEISPTVLKPIVRWACPYRKTPCATG